MRKINDLAVVTRSYSQNGQDKKHWQNVGAIYQTDDGHTRVRLDAFFNFSALKQDNSDSVWIAAFPPKDKQQGNFSQSYGQSHDFKQYDEYKGFDSNATLPEGEPPF